MSRVPKVAFQEVPRPFLFEAGEDLYYSDVCTYYNALLQIHKSTFVYTAGGNESCVGFVNRSCMPLAFIRVEIQRVLATQSFRLNVINPVLGVFNE